MLILKAQTFPPCKNRTVQIMSFFFADNSANHFLDSAMILRVVVVDGGYSSLLKAGFCPAFAVQRKLAFFSACLVAVKLLPLGFVNCNLNQQVWTSTCWLKKKSSANCSSMSVVQYMPSWCRKWGHVLDSENKARIYRASCEIMKCIAVLNNGIYILYVQSKKQRISTYTVAVGINLHNVFISSYSIS